MKWASAVSGAEDLSQAIQECTTTVRDQLDGATPDLAVVFPSRQHEGSYDDVPAAVAEHLAPRILLGCSAGGVIGGGREVEHGPGFSLTAAVLPEVDVHPFHLESDGIPVEDATSEAWEAALGGTRIDADPHFLLLPDPFSFDAGRLLAGLDRTFPSGKKVGGMASGGREAGENALFLGPERLGSGLVGIALSGNISVDTIVAQGCRPVGEPMFITSCRENVALEIDGSRPRDILQELYGRLDARDRDLFREALFLGIVMQEAQSQYGQGDFLIRNVVGFDPDSGALAVGARLKENQVVQFHVRDARTSAEDLQALLAAHPREPSAQGSLLFSCLGRGEHLYGRPDHDTDAFHEHLGEVPLGGFFCNGEIGPVHGTTFLHGYTSSFGLFRPRS